MSNIIQLFERLGQDATLQHRDAQQSAIQATELTTELKGALLTNDAVTLERQLDICPDIFCIMVPAEDNEPQESEDSPEETIQPLVVNG